MGIRFTCPNGHKLHVKTFLAGRRGVCPQCGAKILITTELSPPASHAIMTGPGGSLIAAPVPAPAEGAYLDTGSQSIIIAVADSPAASQPLAAAPSSPVQPVLTQSPVDPLPPKAVEGPPLSVSRSETQPQPLIAPGHRVEVSPAVSYVARRERNQFTIAVLLLMAVIVLAGVLIWVLRRDSETVPAEKSASITLYQLSATAYVAQSLNHC